jgi:hypothetical protein
VKVLLGDLGATKLAQLHRRDCSIHQGFFALYQAPGKSAAWVAEVPTPQAWEGKGNDEKIDAEFEAFLRQLHSFQVKHCLPPGGDLVARRLVLENLPVPLAKTLLYKYSYRLGAGFLDLEPGMRLRIERAEFRPSPTHDQTLATYLGTRTAYYELSRNKGNQTNLKLTRMDATPGLPPAPDLPESTLARRTVGMRVYRLFFATKFVPPNRQRAALLIGTREANQLEEATHEIQGDPEIGCSRFTPQIACVTFDGPVIASPELRVVVNGRPTYVPVGSTLGNVLGIIETPERAAVLRTLRIQRLFRGKYASLEFSPRDAAIFRLVLLGRDKISWSADQPPTSKYPIRN